MADEERLDFILARSGGIVVSWPTQSVLSGRMDVQWESWENRTVSTREELDAAMAECTAAVEAQREQRFYARAAAFSGITAENASSR